MIGCSLAHQAIAEDKIQAAARLYASDFGEINEKAHGAIADLGHIDEAVRQILKEITRADR